ncbi:hypothetical protein D3C86_1397710 [compost metagenome]
MSSSGNRGDSTGSGVGGAPGEAMMTGLSRGTGVGVGVGEGEGEGEGLGRGVGVGVGLASLAGMVGLGSAFLRLVPAAPSRPSSSSAHPSMRNTAMRLTIATEGFRDRRAAGIRICRGRVTAGEGRRRRRPSTLPKVGNINIIMGSTGKPRCCPARERIDGRWKASAQRRKWPQRLR